MTDLKLIKMSLLKLCENSYTVNDILLVVDHFRIECKKLLNIVGATNYIYNNDYGDLEKKINDYAIDLIAPLFARNETGEFIMLKKHFNEVFTCEDEKLEKAIMQMLNVAVKQGMIRIYEDTDPVNKVFHYSIKYLLKKRTDWEKSNLNSHCTSISKVGSLYSKATMEEVEYAFLLTPTKTATQQLKMVLADLIDRKKLAVPLTYLLLAFREYLKHNNEIIFETVEPESEGDSVDYTIDDCIRVIDSQILISYISSGKYNQRERIGFRLAVKDYLIDLTQNGGVEQYYYYLSKNIGFALTYDDYMEKYRTQFEYVLKKSKEYFSAMVKNVSS